MFRIGSGGAHDITAAHAKADRSHAATAHALCRVEEFQNGSGVVDDHLVREFWPRLDLAQRFSFEPVYRNGLLLFVSKLEMDSLAVAIVKVRIYAVIADRADATGDIVELFTHTPDVHVKDHSRKRSVLVRVRDECFHHTVGSSDLDELFSHLVFPPNGRRNFRDRLNFSAKELRQKDSLKDRLTAVASRLVCKLGGLLAPVFILV